LSLAKRFYEDDVYTSKSSGSDAAGRGFAVANLMMGLVRVERVERVSLPVGRLATGDGCSATAFDAVRADDLGFVGQLQR
jgi:hypothetical protein